MQPKGTDITGLCHAPVQGPISVSEDLPAHRGLFAGCFRKDNVMCAILTLVHWDTHHPQAATSS